MHKRYPVMLILALCLLTALGCGSKAINYTVDYGTSEIYTNKDMEKAIDAIFDEFNDFEDRCTMINISYAGDEEVTKENLDYCNALGQEKTEYVDCIVFQTTFRTPMKTKGAFNSNTTYDWTWYLAREEGKDWVVLTFGY